MPIYNTTLTAYAYARRVTTRLCYTHTHIRVSYGYMSYGWWVGRMGICKYVYAVRVVVVGIA